MQLRRHSKIDILVLLLVVVGGFFAVRHATGIGDAWHGLFYRPSAAIRQLAEDAGMNAEGKKLFYRFSPQLVNGSELQAKCGNAKLGCTAGRSIYILDSDDPAQYNRNIVTAAHEMLHVAYARLPDYQKQALEQETDAALADDTNQIVRGIQEELATYDQQDYYNEAHSIIGSELPDAGPALNTYYQRYFSDRSKTTDAFLASPEGK